MFIDEITARLLIIFSAIVIAFLIVFAAMCVEKNFRIKELIFDNRSLKAHNANLNKTLNYYEKVITENYKKDFIEQSEKNFITEPKANVEEK